MMMSDIETEIEKDAVSTVSLYSALKFYSIKERRDSRMHLILSFGGKSTPFDIHCTRD
jgi:hypothetical protein